MKQIIFCIIAIFCMVGCGIKGDPLPPAEEETLQKQSAESANSSSKQEEPLTQSAKDAKKKTK